MNKYGIDNVRGGFISTMNITPVYRDVIDHIIIGARDQCFICRGSHFIADCPHKDYACRKCGRFGNHEYKTCCHKLTVYGELINLT